MRADPRFKPLPDEPATLLNEGRVADAIKVLRETNDLDRSYARAWIDWHIEENPMLRVQLETQQKRARRKAFLWFLVIDVLVVVACIYYFTYYKS